VKRLFLLSALFTLALVIGVYLGLLLFYWLRVLALRPKVPPVWRTAP